MEITYKIIYANWYILYGIQATKPLSTHIDTHDEKSIDLEQRHCEKTDVKLREKSLSVVFTFVCGISTTLPEEEEK